MSKSRMAGIAVAAAGLLIAGTTASTAGVMQLINSGDIADNTVRSIDVKNGTLKPKDMKPWAVKRFKQDNDSFSGAVLRSLTYKNGGGGDATVACADTEAESQKYIAVSGGVTADVPSTTTTMNGDFDVAASFPGRMDWSTGQPKPGRLDGWVILGAQGHSDKLIVWALCVPKESITVQSDELPN